MNISRGAEFEQDTQRTRVKQALLRVFVILMMPLAAGGGWFNSSSGHFWTSLQIASVFWVLYLPSALPESHVLDFLIVSVPDPMLLTQITLVVLPGIYFFVRYSSSGRRDELEVAGLTLALNVLVLGILEASTYSLRPIPSGLAMEASVQLSSVGVFSMLVFVVLPSARILLDGGGRRDSPPAPDNLQQAGRYRRLRSMKPGRILLYLGLLLPSRLSMSLGGYDVSGGYSQYSFGAPLLWLAGASSWSSDYNTSSAAVWLSGCLTGPGTTPLGIAALNIDVVFGWASVLYLSRCTMRYAGDARYRRAYWKSVALFCAIAVEGGVVNVLIPIYYYWWSVPTAFPVFAVVSFISVRILSSKRPLLLEDDRGALDADYRVSEPTPRPKVVDLVVKVPLYYVAISKLKRRLRKTG